MVSLALARSELRARTIVNAWSSKDVLPTACANLAADYSLIVAYTTTALLLSLLLVSMAKLPWSCRLTLVVATLGAGYCDLLENRLLERVLRCAPGDLPAWRESIGVPSSMTTSVTAWTRTVSQLKWTLLLVVGLSIVVLLVSLARRWWLGRRPETAPAPPTDTKTFAKLMVDETDGVLRARPQPTSEIDFDVRHDIGGINTNEPWVRSRHRDLAGLALSGGGIRSATFNLGLLAGMSRLARDDAGRHSLLDLFDYLSTVSGGGYIGSFWTAWMARPSRRHRSSWPAVPDTMIEAPAVRHLREFSAFLAPRWGFFEAEMWQGLVSLIAGLIPSLAVAFAVIGLALVAWLTSTFFLACPRPAAGASVATLLTFVLLAWLERWWRSASRFDSEEELRASRRTYRVWAAVAIVTVGWIQWCLAATYDGAWFYAVHEKWQRIDLPADWSAYEKWWALAGMTARRLVVDAFHPHAWIVSPRLFDLPLAWFLGAVVMMIARPFCWIVARGQSHAGLRQAAFDRAVMRLLGSSLGSALIAVLWHFSINLDGIKRAVVAGVVAAGGFAALRNWMSVVMSSGPETGVLDRIKRYVPQILAYLTVGLAIVVTGYWLIAWGRADWFRWYLASAGMAATIGLMLCLDPSEIGLHAFYRDRLTRAYCGASNADPSMGGNRQTDVRSMDDIVLAVDRTSLPDVPPPRPLHLVCCAANDLAGDPIETLSRGARSAVLSRYGIAVGPRWTATQSPVTLGGAITASAAAFNSNMGAVSMKLGPLVSFLMSALNLRLGLWVPNPLRTTTAPAPLLPGRRFFLELVGATTATATSAELHLSDGGHFENLAMYELVRRHCRYIVVSDCGEDPEVAFVDFGNAARRIREDFGVEIDIDLTPLRPNAAQRSQQHVVVGTIHYSDFDKGVLLYVKPTLTGDEPPDVLQYATANEQFPHESTADQFYDEAQWEAYRKLGEHTAGVVFGFVSRHPKGSTPQADWVFTSARHEWIAEPVGLAERVAHMTERFDALQASLGALSSIAREAFPEIGRLTTKETAPATDPQEEESRARERRKEEDKRAVDASHDPDGQMVALSACLRMLQFMEDTWTSCDLDAAWSHPLNIGWVNLFARWATAPTFRMWWPFLSPLYSLGLRRFLVERFPVLEGDAEHRGQIKNLGHNLADGLAAHWWMTRDATPPEANDTTKTVYAYEIQLPRPGSERPIPVQVALVRVSRGLEHLWWTSDDLFVPPSLWGAEFGRDFLRDLLERLTDEEKDKRGRGAPHAERCVVYVRQPDLSDDLGSWGDRVRFIEFYKAVGFEIRPVVPKAPDGKPGRAIELRLELLK